MSDIIEIVNILDRTSYIMKPDDIDEYDLSLMVILISRYHVLTQMGKNVKYEIVKTNQYEIYNCDTKEIFFRIDENKNIFWKKDKTFCTNLENLDYIFYKNNIYNINDVPNEYSHAQQLVWIGNGIGVSKTHKKYILENPIPHKFENVSDTQGMREYMEDTHIFVKMGDVKLYGVFDGHGGSSISSMLKTKLPEYVYTELKNIDINNPLLVKSALKNAFIYLDKHFYDIFVEKDGSTAIVALIIGDSLYFANLGDSRGILLENGNLALETSDHKPNNKMERDRAIKAGSNVIFGRVGGTLAVSRAFGDRGLKTDLDGNYIGKDAPVSSEPDIYFHKLSKQYKIVLATDGLWDVMSNSEVADYVENYYSNTISNELVDIALDKNSKDNITVMTITN